MNDNTEIMRDLMEFWQNNNTINNGDTLLLHSNITRIYMRLRRQYPQVKVDDILQALLNVLGDKGTLILPLFNLSSFTEHGFFSINETKSEMGKLTEAARLRFSGIRTGHPIYNFFVMGHHADKFKGLDNTEAFGDDSPFAMLLDLNAKIAVLDIVPNNSMTFYHFMERRMHVDYRFAKEFSGEYIDSDGNSSQRTYSFYVRDRDNGVLTDLDPMEEIVKDAGLYKGDFSDFHHGLRVIDANEIYNFVIPYVEKHGAKDLLYKLAE